jgi:translation initiation factor 2-alpha kinase 1
LHDYIRFRNKQYAETLSNDSLVDTKRNIEIFSQILQGTAYIHDQGLIHRDLKPSNIFLSMSTTPLNQHHHHSSSKSTSRRKRGSVSSSSTGSLPYENSVLNESNMWEESWVPKIGDFGLAAEAMDDPLNESGNGLLIPTPITSLPPSPVKSSFSNSMNTTDDNMMNQFVMASAGDGKPKRPKPRRTRTIGVGTRTVSELAPKVSWHELYKLKSYYSSTLHQNN